MEAEKNRSTPLRNSNGATHRPLTAAPTPAEGPLFEKVSLRDRFRAFGALLRVINVAV